MRNIQSFEEFTSKGGGDSPASPIPAQPDPNDYKSKLLKLIPSEIIATYIAIDGIIQSSGVHIDTSSQIQWGVLGVLFIINPVYLYKVSGVDNKLQLLFATLGFLVWVFALGGPFETLGNKPLVHLLGAITLPLYTLITPLLVKPK